MKEKDFTNAKLILGTIFKKEKILDNTIKILKKKWGKIDLASDVFEFKHTDYYEKEMRKPLFRKFFSFYNLIHPENLPDYKIFTNRMEENLAEKYHKSSRVINLDPGYILPGCMIMATAKNYSHRVPLKNGIYAHLEYLFSKNGVIELDWTYTDFRTKDYKNFFFKVREIYLKQLRKFSF